MRAEYDRENNRVVQVEMDDGRKVATGFARVLGAETEWLPVRVEYPSDYQPRFQSLLKAHNVRYDYDKKSDSVVLRYPDADFSPEAIRENTRQIIRGQIRNLLAETDWAVVRQMETGKPLPEDIAKQREMYRNRSDVLESTLANTSDEDLLNFDFVFDYSAPGEVIATPTVVEGGDGRPWITDATHPDEEGQPVRLAETEEFQKNALGAPTGVAPPAEIKESHAPWMQGPAVDE